MKLFVGNLPHSLSEEELKEVFQEHGTVVSAKIIIDRMTNRSKGFGFVEMSSREDGEKAMSALHEKEVKGRPLVVNEARPQEERKPRERREFNGNRGGERSGPRRWQ